MQGAGLAAQKESGPSVKLEGKETVKSSRISNARVAATVANLVATTVSLKDILGVHLDIFTIYPICTQPTE